MRKEEEIIKNRMGIESPEKRASLDFEVGDFVQIVADGKRDAGRIGTIIGISLRKYNGKDELAYTVRFSDYESAGVSAVRLRFLSKGKRS